MVKFEGWWRILVSLFLAMALSVVPIPEWAAAWRPAWVIMVLIYWCMALPASVGVGIAWMVGLLMDVLKNSLLGQHGVGFAIIAFITVSAHRRLRVYPLLQQAVFVGLMVGLNALWVFWVRGMLALPTKHALYWQPALTSIFFWPWLFVILRDVRRQTYLNH